jgi:uncharacterized protein YukE
VKSIGCSLDSARPSGDATNLDFKSQISGSPQPSKIINQKSTMTQAIVDPGELRLFAQMLKQFNQDLTDRTTALSAQLHSLSSTWRDQENLKFTEQFEQHLRYLQRFIDANNQHIPYLTRKAERIEEYLQQK